MKNLRGAIPGHIARRVATLRCLDDALRDCLPAECCNHCRAAGVSDGTLFLIADSPAWRARLHFYSSRIINHFSRLGKPPIVRIKVRVAHALGVRAPRRPAGSARTIPPETARGLASLARDTEDPALRQVLERLSAHGRRD